MRISVTLLNHRHYHLHCHLKTNIEIPVCTRRGLPYSRDGPMPLLCIFRSLWFHP